MPGAHWRIFHMQADFNNAGDRRYADEFKPISNIEERLKAHAGNNLVKKVRLQI